MIKNESYNIIIEQLKNKNDFTEEQKKILMTYATKIKKYNINNLQEENIDTIIDAIKEINTELKKSNNTSVTAKRLEKEIKIIEKLNNYNSLNSEEKFNIQLEIENLYNELDIPTRKNSNLSYRLIKRKENDNTCTKKK